LFFFLELQRKFFNTVSLSLSSQKRTVLSLVAATAVADEGEEAAAIAVLRARGREGAGIARADLVVGGDRWSLDVDVDVDDGSGRLALTVALPVVATTCWRGDDGDEDVSVREAGSMSLLLFLPARLLAGEGKKERRTKRVISHLLRRTTIDFDSHQTSLHFLEPSLSPLHSHRRIMLEVEYP
jgi:hypothetical protein